MWKWILGLFILAVIVCGGGGAWFVNSEQFKELKKKFDPSEKVTEVRLEAAERGDLIKTINAPGTVEPRTNVKIYAQVSARITSLTFKVGDSVRKGDVLVRLDSVDLEAQLESAQAALKADEARLDGARASLAHSLTDLNRAKTLFESKDIAESSLQSAQTEYDSVVANVRAAEQGIEIAKANIRRAERDLKNAVIEAPMNGVVVNVESKEGEVVLGTFNNQGQLIMEIADTSEMVMKARVDETIYAGVHAGQTAKILTNMYPDDILNGVVERVGLMKKLIPGEAGFFEVEILLDPVTDKRLGSGLTANVDIEIQTMHDVIKVPTQAVLDRRVDELPKEIVDKGQNIDKTKAFARVVYMIKDGMAVPVPVTVGISDLTHTVITTGLNEGDKVITGPYKVLVTIKHDQKMAEEGSLSKPAETPTTPPAENAPTSAAATK